MSKTTIPVKQRVAESVADEMAYRGRHRLPGMGKVSIHFEPHEDPESDGNWFVVVDNDINPEHLFSIAYAVGVDCGLSFSKK